MVLLSSYLWTCLLWILPFFFLCPWVQASEDREALRYLPVQDSHEGRIKPFDTFARETLQLIYGRETFKKTVKNRWHEELLSSQGEVSTNSQRETTIKTVKIEAVDMVAMWALWPEEWGQQEIVQVRHVGLREALGWENKARIYFSPSEIMDNPNFALLTQELRSKQKSREKLTPYFQAIQTLESQIRIFVAIAKGVIPRIMPQIEGDHWLSMGELKGEDARSFYPVIENLVGYIATHVAHVKKEEGRTFDEGRLRSSLEQFQVRAYGKFPDKYGNPTLLRAEVHYEKMQPFMWAWILYLMTIFFLMASQGQGRLSLSLYKVGWFFVVLGGALHTYGMGLRIFIQQRPPVGTMYETVIWVPWVALVVAMVMEIRRRKRGPVVKKGIVLMCASLISVLCLMVSDLAPVILDDSMKPLEPVLRDNFWLLTHVVIIVSSYGVFFLSFALADIVLFYFLCGEKKYRKEIKAGAHAIYKSIQLGFLLLAVGTILGGIWADYSWGRFWGWDPKETWAFIALMGYLAVLHGRLAGWLRDFGMAAGALLSFSLVIMAWYGVNFVLGAGLHSYGFGAGGVEYVSGFVLVHFVYLGYVATVLRYRRVRGA